MADEKKSRTKKESIEEQLEKLIANHENSYRRWQHYLEHGGSDPTWSDGSNMNLIRNHIIGYKRRIKELCEKSGIELPNEYSKELPAEVSSDFMANPELIDENARTALSVLEAHPAYTELLSYKSRLSPKQRASIYFDTVIGYVSRLRDAIGQRNLINMRCFSRHENYVKSFEQCLEKAKALEPEQYQLSLFDAEAS